MNFNLEAALAIAVEAHAGQRERNGRPFAGHPLRVMARCDTEEARIVAVLHDVVEDCPDWSFGRLRECGLPEPLLAALDCVTKRAGEDYMAFIARAASNPIARRVKLADLEDNLDVRRLPEVREKDRERINKYLRAYRWLGRETGAQPGISGAVADERGQAAER